MTTYALLWNPKEWPHSNILRLIEDIAESGSAEEDWRFRAVRQVKLGDKVLLFKTGTRPKGIFALGYVAGSPFRGTGSDGQEHSMARIKFDEMVDPMKEFIVSEDRFVNFPPFSVGQASGNSPLPAAASAALWDAIKENRDVRLARRDVSQIYDGLSLAVHLHKPPALTDCIERIGRPVRRAKTCTQRDSSLLCKLVAESGADGVFDPSSMRIAADLGVISRLASLGYLSTDGEKCYLTNEGYRAGAGILEAAARDISAETLDEYEKDTGKLGDTEKEALAKQRIGQASFKRGLLRYWDGRCCLTGITEPGLLRASHIVAWAKCESDAHRLDIHNGLLLAAHLDAAFDTGLITIDEDSMVCLSPKLSAQTAHHLGLSSPMTVRGLGRRHHENLKWHREIKFKRL